MLTEPQICRWRKEKVDQDQREKKKEEEDKTINRNEKIGIKMYKELDITQVRTQNHSKCLYRSVVLELWITTPLRLNYTFTGVT